MEVKNDILIKSVKFYILSKTDDIYMKGKLYIGKSVNINVRFSFHYNNSYKKNEKVYKYIRNNDGFNNFVMTVIDEHIYTGTKDEIKNLVAIQERLYIEEYNASLNTYRPIVSNEERLELCRKRNEYKYKNDPVWRDKKLNQIKINQNFKYQNDPEYREKKKTKFKEYYYNKKK